MIGDGFNRAVVEDFVEEIGADPRWRDLPVIVPPSARNLDPERMPNADQVGGDAQAIAAHILPFARMHAFSARLKRLAASLDQKGSLAPETGLMTHDAFMSELHRVAATAEAAAPACRSRGSPSTRCSTAAPASMRRASPGGCCARATSPAATRTARS